MEETLTAQGKASLLLGLLKTQAKYDRMLKDLGREIGKVTQELNDAMLEQDVDEITIEGLAFKPKTVESFALNKDITDATRWDDCQEFLTWLSETGNSGVIKKIETVHLGTREKLIKDWLDAGNELPNFCTKSSFQTVNWNKSLLDRMVNGEKK